MALNSGSGVDPGTFPAKFTFLDAFAGYDGGTCGIIVDNISPEAQASSIYFSTRGAYTSKCTYGWICAVKLTQAGLL